MTEKVILPREPEATTPYLETAQFAPFLHKTVKIGSPKGWVKDGLQRVEIYRANDHIQIKRPDSGDLVTASNLL